MFFSDFYLLTRATSTPFGTTVVWFCIEIRRWTRGNTETIGPVCRTFTKSDWFSKFSLLVSRLYLACIPLTNRLKTWTILCTESDYAYFLRHIGSKTKTTSVCEKLSSRITCHKSLHAVYVTQILIPCYNNWPRVQHRENPANSAQESGIL